MQVLVSNTEGLERQMTVTLPAQQVEQEVSKRLSKLRKTAKLPGFRPGKIPASVIDKKFGSDVLHEIAGEMINRSYLEALVDQKIEPATRPSIEPKAISRGEDVEYTATFEVFPEVSRTDLSGLSVERQVCEVSEDDINETIETIRKQRLIWNTAETAAEEGDRVTIDFSGSLNGESFEGGEANDYPVVIGEGMLLKDFETGLIGMKAAEQKTIDVGFPEDYPAENLAGNTVQFEITAKEVAKSQLPELNEEFYKSLGIEDGNEQTFRDQVKENMQRELKNRLQASLRDNVLKALADNNDIELPKQLVNEEMSHIQEANRQQMKQQGLDESQVKIDDEQLREEAAKRVKLSVLVREVITAHELKLDKQRIDTTLNEMAQTYDDKEAFMRWYTQDKQRMQQLESSALEQLVVEKLAETAEVVDKNVSFKSLMNVE